MSKKPVEILAAERQGAGLLSADTRDVESCIGFLREQWGGDTFHAEVDGTMYRIAPVEED